MNLRVGRYLNALESYSEDQDQEQKAGRGIEEGDQEDRDAWSSVLITRGNPWCKSVKSILWFNTGT